MTKTFNKLTTSISGKEGEKLACDFLKNKGLKLLTSRFRSYFGEIDLIMQDKDVFVFIEVKFRKEIQRYGSGAECVNTRKKIKIIKTALIYLQKEKCENKACRFDVIDIHQNQINWIKDAFGI